MTYAINLLKNELKLLEEQQKMCTGKEVHYENTKRKIDSLRDIINRIESKRI